MIPVGGFAKRKVAVFGLGGSGVATARALLAGGAEIAAWDDDAHAVEKAQEAGIAIEDLASADWRGFAALVLAPGAPLTHPKPHWTVVKARAAGVEIIGDIELFCRERRRTAPNAPFVAITGTNGKSTTAALTAHLLRQAGRAVELGGNIGVPILELAPPALGRIHVVEVSSFQIDLAPTLDPTIGALINVTPDHLDRHGTMENYIAIKERLVAGAEAALIGVDDEPGRAIAERLRARGGRRVVTISLRPASAADVVSADGRIIGRNDGRVEILGDVAAVSALRGAHNAQNAAFACAAALHLGLTPQEISVGLASFPGLAHRMEQIGKKGRVLFVNDSKATNADAAEKALLSFDDIFWILGGQAKEGGIERLRPLFSRVAKAYLIGAATETFGSTLEASVPFERCGALETATAAAARDAAASSAPEPVVLLSPACASYDQFANFEARGDRFRALVKDLIAARAAAEPRPEARQASTHVRSIS
jgi:UDP-N-acetylmuramoylalanine--D-glutamate ligase